MDWALVEVEAGESAKVWVFESQSRLPGVGVEVAERGVRGPPQNPSYRG
jgi:hypothetical protein